VCEFEKLHFSVQKLEQKKKNLTILARLGKSWAACMQISLLHMTTCTLHVITLEVCAKQSSEAILAHAMALDT
jgi:hypothetical protein